MKIGKSYGKVLIVSSWKMGSTLLTDLLGSHPLAFVLYEPLWHFGIERLRNKNSTKYKEQLGLIRDLLNCNFSSFRRKLFQKNILLIIQIVGLTDESLRLRRILLKIQNFTSLWEIFRQIDLFQNFLASKSKKFQINIQISNSTADLSS